MPRDTKKLHAKSAPEEKPNRLFRAAFEGAKLNDLFT
jgi:hypothetical protein